MAKIIALSGDVGWEINAKDIRADLKSANGGDVEFHINSPGGFVSEGIEIFNIIRAYEGHTTGVITGVAASMASYFILACNKVVAYDNAIYMIHNPWSFAIGDYNDMQKAFDMLKGMAGLLAKAYANKADTALSKIKSLMDDETFFFGDEMLTAGFVDEMLDGSADDGGDDKASAVITAKASMETCLNRMRASDAANSELEKAVAYFDGMSALIETPKKPTTPAATVAAADDNTPAGAGINKQEVKHMSLEVLLADPANASAKAEFDNVIGKARTEGKTAAKDEMKDVIARVSPTLTSADYGADVKDAGIKAITGEGHISTYETLVVIADRDIEKAKAVAAAKAKAEGGDGNGGAETPPQTAGADADAQADIDKKKADVLAQGGF